MLDLGCGPGRLVVELARQGRQAAGVDTSRVAVRLARKAGATALCRSIFDPVPGEGGWDSVLLADGNIGIGGDPVRAAGALPRADRATGPGARRAGPAGHGACAPTGSGSNAAASAAPGSTGRTSASTPIDGPAADAGLRVEETWERAGRSFAALVPDAVVRPLGRAS